MLISFPYYHINVPLLLLYCAWNISVKPTQLESKLSEKFLNEAGISADFLHLVLKNLHLLHFSEVLNCAWAAYNVIALRLHLLVITISVGKL